MAHDPIHHISRFRFYQELNDFLPAAKRQACFDYSFRGNPTVKDIIEAIGVPHGEIDLILVDGDSVGFDFHLHGGESISVYPVFEALDISPVNRLRPKPLRASRFIVDANLGRLARKLRVLGFDTLYDSNYADEMIVQVGASEGRIILTRDIGLLKRRAVTHGYFVRSTQPASQIVEVVSRLQLEPQLAPFSRCSWCNHPLEYVDIEILADRVPDSVKAQHDSYKFCQGCKQVYWPGSHYHNMQRWIAQLPQNKSISDQCFYQMR